MAQATLTQSVDQQTASNLRQSRVDLLIEREDGPGRFVQDEGPFEEYQRVLLTEETADGSVMITEVTEFRLALPIWRHFFFTQLMRRALVELDREPRQRRWWPKEVMSSHTTVFLSVIAVLNVMAGYLGVIIGQTISFASKEFGADNSLQANTLAALRIGVVLSALVIGRADRIGRRPLLLGFALASILFTASGALSNDMLTLGITQALARGFGTGLFTLLTLSAIEEIPASVRTLSVALMSMATGFGAALVLFILPTADISIGSWRIVYLVSLAFLPVLWWAARALPETRRFSTAVTHHSSGEVNWRRFGMLATSAFCASLFLSPASQLQNQYLLGERGFSAAKISLFRLLISSPVALVFLAAGFVADRYGRKWLGSTGLFLGASMSLLSYFSDDAALWITSLASVWLLGASFTALRTYSTELFPTKARAKIGGWLDVIAVSGSATGLVLVGYLSDRWGSIGSALMVVVWGPMLVAFLVATRYPETAAQELETFNPGDTAPQH